MAGYNMDPYTLTLYASGAMALIGAVVYLAFYLMFRRMYGDKVRSPSRLKMEPVMCGLEYREEELTVPISRVFTDIMERSLPRLHRSLRERGGTGVLNDWFAWMLIVLSILVILFSIMG